MSPEYLALAAERCAAVAEHYRQPEEFGYDFSSWVSPYTKGAHANGGVAVVLQDWASVEGLSGEVRPEVQALGRMPNLLTNRRLEALLAQVFGLHIGEVYATNVFPFVKAGSMSASLRRAHVMAAARKFVMRELELAKPRVILALGRVPFELLRECGVQSVALPHPAARIGSTATHANIWRQALHSAGHTYLNAHTVA